MGRIYFISYTDLIKYLSILMLRNNKKYKNLHNVQPFDIPLHLSITAYFLKI